jgi:iron(III) transport system ATP-binding protein
VPVGIERHDGDQALVRIGAATILLPPAELAIRPRAVRLTAHSDGLTGKIAKAAYLGDLMEYQVTVDGLAKELFVIDADVAAPRTAGAQVGIVLDACGAVLVPS